MGAVRLTGAAVLADRGWLDSHGVLVQGGRIAAVLPDTADSDAPRVVLPAGSLLAPGLIDIQVNGGGGVLFNDRPTQEGARAIASAHRALGTTAILPTLITDGPSVMHAAGGVVAEPEAGLWGLHFEGPFLSPEKPGVHPPAHIRLPEEADLAFLERLARRAEGRVLLTLAPEKVSDAILRRLSAAGVKLSGGHSVASYERTMGALASGLSGFTHLFNAMPAISARDPGIAAAALADPESFCGVIADGIHVHPAMLRLLLAAKPERVMLVSDAMPPTGTSKTSFQLQGRTIYRSGGALRTADGTLAGADICLADAVRFCVRELGLPAAQALRMATEAPAALLGLGGEIGRIAPGLRADLVLMTKDLQVLGTWLGGKWQGEPGVLARAA